MKIGIETSYTLFRDGNHKTQTVALRCIRIADNIRGLINNIKKQNKSMTGDFCGGISLPEKTTSRRERFAP